jgi:DNA-directed RNA polymerase subunit K/omega
MIRDKVDSTPVIDLTGPQGNAYALMGMASRYARQLGLDSDAVLAEMQEGNYENLVQVFDRYFGEYVILER